MGSAKFRAKNAVNHKLMILGGSDVLQHFGCLLI